MKNMLKKLFRDVCEFIALNCVDNAYNFGA